MSSLRALPSGGLQQLIASLLAEVGPMTVVEVARLAERTTHVTWEAMRRMHQKREVHVADWQSPPDGTQGRRARVFALGSADDKPEPPRKSAKKRDAEYRERHKATLLTRSAVRRRARGVKPSRLTHDNVWSRLVARPDGN